MDTLLIERIKSVINDRGDTPNSFARKADIDVSNVSKMLSGKQKITIKTLKKISDAYGINIQWLQTGEGEMLRPCVTQTSHGDCSPNINGNANAVNLNTTSALDKALNEIAEQRKLVAKSQEQIDRLITIIETLK